jgi:lipopolysaccharide assembly outer membrane protein LptD (OstA)
MESREIFENQLRIVGNLYACNIETRYDPEYLSVPKLSKIINVHRTTLKLWQKENKVKSNDNGEIQLQSLVNHILYKSKKKTFGESCTWWKEEELKTFNTDRSPLAKRIMKCRLKKRGLL